MRFTLPATLWLIATIAFCCGCSPGKPDKEQAEPNEQAKPQDDRGHVHGEDDALVWVEEKIEHKGFVIALGHHAKHLHAATRAEPAVMITKDGKDVADANVFNSLVSADGARVIRAEVGTTYEPKTSEEPAHYAQGKLHLPKGSDKFIIRFRVELPGDGGEFKRDITVDVEQD